MMIRERRVCKVHRANLYSDTLCHFNPNHDPRTGRFIGTTEKQKRVARALKTKKDVDKIIGSLDREDLQKLMLAGEFTPQELIDKWRKEGTLYPDYGGIVAKRILKKVGDVPVAFLDIHDDGTSMGGVEFAVDKNHRNKGYGSEVVKKGMKWIDNNKDKLTFTTVGWAVLSDNTPSRHLAEKHGFELSERDKKIVDQPRTSTAPLWLLYEKRIK